VSVPELTVLFDFKDPYSYLALAPTRSLIESMGLTSHWFPLLGNTLKAPVKPQEQDDRGGWHRFNRAAYLARDLVRYAEARAIPSRHFADGGLYRQTSGEVAAMGFNWATGAGAESARAYLDRAFEGYWDGDTDLDSVADVQALLQLSGIDAEGFDLYSQQEGVEELMAQRQEIAETGGFVAPSCLLAGEAFVGRQHLPYLAERIRRLTREDGRT
jgi:2-hydroxychromene-2-carboxylate isomerase